MGVLMCSLGGVVGVDVVVDVGVVGGVDWSGGV